MVILFRGLNGSAKLRFDGDGALLCSSVCATCHDLSQQAELVTDLRALKHQTTSDYWQHWIEHGSPGIHDAGLWTQRRRIA